MSLDRFIHFGKTLSDKVRFRSPKKAKNFNRGSLGMSSGSTRFWLCGNFAIDIVYVLMSYLGPIVCVRVWCLCCALPDSCCGYFVFDLLNSVYLVVVCAHVGIES